MSPVLLLPVLSHVDFISVSALSSVSFNVCAVIWLLKSTFIYWDTLRKSFRFASRRFVQGDLLYYVFTPACSVMHHMLLTLCIQLFSHLGKEM